MVTYRLEAFLVSCVYYKKESHNTRPCLLLVLVLCRALASPKFHRLVPFLPFCRTKALLGSSVGFLVVYGLGWDGTHSTWVWSCQKSPTLGRLQVATTSIGTSASTRGIALHACRTEPWWSYVRLGWSAHCHRTTADIEHTWAVVAVSLCPPF
jgi:hypothetical protein